MKVQLMKVQLINGFIETLCRCGDAAGALKARAYGKTLLGLGQKGFPPSFSRPTIAPGRRQPHPTRRAA
ncbi:MAG: hypothetical protein CSA62_12145 [Planctomycetota bacterium]|nr:MAG: hypothetical protein CSA62_12145 [Planctomycetota bacterium]